MEQAEFEALLASAQLHHITQLFQDTALSRDQFVQQSSQYLSWFCAQHDPRAIPSGDRHKNYDLLNALNDSQVWHAFLVHEPQGQCPEQPHHFASLLRIYCQLGMLVELLHSPCLPFS